MGKNVELESTFANLSQLENQKIKSSLIGGLHKVFNNSRKFVFLQEC